MTDESVCFDQASNEALIAWFCSDGVGVSSREIVQAAKDISGSDGLWNYPNDPADFGRCARLLKLVPSLREPAFKRLSEDGSPVWKALISRWDEIEATMEKEAGIDWSKGSSAPDTYELMIRIKSDARLQDKHEEDGLLSGP